MVNVQRNIRRFAPAVLAGEIVALKNGEALFEKASCAADGFPLLPRFRFTVVEITSSTV
jgi:hypothetical protein